MSNKKQSSIEWLVNVVQSCIAPDYIPIEIVKQAKAMHEEEIIKAWIADDNELQRLRAEQYYKDTFA